MKVKLLVGMAGADFSASPGDIIEATADEAKRFFEAGIAEPVRAEPIETAVAQTHEKAVTRGRKAKGG